MRRDYGSVTTLLNYEEFCAHRRRWRVEGRLIKDHCFWLDFWKLARLNGRAFTGNDFIVSFLAQTERRHECFFKLNPALVVGTFQSTYRKLNRTPILSLHFEQGGPQIGHGSYVDRIILDTVHDQNAGGFRNPIDVSVNQQATVAEKLDR
jgi:hypothetical protein